MAAGMPSTRRLGITLVNSEPGPKVITSASFRALTAAASGRTFRGRSRTDLIRCRLRLMRVSPTTFTPLSRVASSATLSDVAGDKIAGAFFKPAEGTIWSLADFNQVEFTLANPGAKPVHVICRVDNAWAKGKNNSAPPTRSSSPAMTW